MAKRDDMYPDKRIETLPLAEILASAPLIAGNEAASLRDIGDGLAVFEIHTKMNSVGHAVLDVLEEAIRRAGQSFQGLIVANDAARAFSAGADITFFLAALANRDFEAVGSFIRRGQSLYLALKYAPAPVVAAVQGPALGGGCELALHSDAIVACADAPFGLPETRLGIIPAWGGCTQMLLRAQEHGEIAGPQAPAAAVFDLVFAGFVAATADKAKAKGVLRPDDTIVAERAALFPAARARALDLARNYEPPQRALITVTGQSGWLGLMQGVRASDFLGRLSETDIRIAEALAGVLPGGEEADMLWRVGEEDLMRRECDALLALAKLPETHARMAHFLKTGEPLRN